MNAKKRGPRINPLVNAKVKPIETTSVSPDDLPQICRLVADCDAPHYCNASVLEENFFKDQGTSAELRQAVFAGGQLIGLCIAALRAATERGHIKWIGIHPSHRRQGVGSHLLRAVEGALSRHSIDTIRAGAAAPNYLFPGVPQRWPVTKMFFESHGYQHTGDAINMTVDLAHAFNSSETCDRLAQEGIEVRRAGLRDREPMNEFLERHWPAWKSEIQRAISNDPISLHLALRHHQILGFSAYDANNVGCGWFGPMGTAPEATGKGIGRVLLHHCLNDLRSQGCTSSIIPWVGPVEFYRRHCGAEITERFWRMEKRVGS